jgi:putative ABC transport system permease protein
MTPFFQDLRYALRMVRKTPAFTAVVVLTLALGIGANTAIFSVVDTVLLRPLPYKESDRLVVVWEKPPKGTRNSVSAANFLDWRDQNKVFEQLVAVGVGNFNLSGRDQPEQISGMRVSAGFFEMLAVQPALGRSFVPEDDRPGAQRVVVLSHALWERRFGADRKLIGEALTMDGEKHVVIGVMPAEFRFVTSPEMWTPLALDPAKAARDFHYLIPVARLKAGVSLEQARAQMEGIARNIERAYPKSNQGWSVTIEPMQEALVAPIRQGVLVLFAAVGFVLLIGCVNVANLLLAKGAARQREIAVRASLGAGRGRLIRQLLTESVVLAVIGGGLGLLLTIWLLRLLSAVLPFFALMATAPLSVDVRVLLFALALSLATGLLFGLVPAYRASKPDLHETLKEAGRSSTGGSGSHRLRGALVVAEVGLSLVLLISAGLMMRSLISLQQVKPGFRPENVLTMRLILPQSRYPTGERVRMFYRQMLEKVEALPGVRAAGLSGSLPLQGWSFGMPFEIEGHPPMVPAERPAAHFQMVSHGYFRTLGISLLKGREFSERDSETSPRVALVNETFVRRFLPKEEALGKRVRVETLISGQQQLGPPVAWEIVGVIRDVKVSTLRSDGEPEIYVPCMQSTWPGCVLSVRTATEPMSMAQAVRAAVQSVDKDQPVTAVRTMEQIVSESVSGPRIRAYLIGAFAGIALVLAGMGIYGVISYAVAQRTHELGIRMALGARRGDLLRMVVGQGMLLTLIGLAIGLAGAFALTRLLSGLLFGVTATDPATFAGVSAVLAAVALAACYIPARRAARVDPMVALRYE